MSCRLTSAPPASGPIHTPAANAASILCAAAVRVPDEAGDAPLVAELCIKSLPNGRKHSQVLLDRYRLARNGQPTFQVSMSVKVIFLDIDGVLNCATTPNPRKFPYIVDLKLLKRFKRLLQRTGVKVVLSSTWRYDPAGIFSAKHWGVPFIDVIPDMPNRPRRDEVIAWLKTHPKVKRFVVIDDEDDELDQLPLFQPSASTGFTETITKGVANYLDGKTDEDMRRTPVVRVLQNIKSAFKGHEG